MKVSFIIPVYKVELYLEQCVNSVLSQTYHDIEVILVDDGSPDHCPEICDSFAVNDKRVKVVHKPNGGLSDARNVGLKESTGDYVIFVDSDDFWIGDGSLEKLISYIKLNPKCQFYGFNCQYYFSKNDTIRKWAKYPNEVLYPINGSTAIVSLIKTGTFPMSAWLKVINRKWLIDNHIIFKKGQIAEDIPWFINLLDNSEKCMFVNDYIYAYRQNVSGSITASGGERSFISLFDIIKTELNILDKRSFTKDAKEALLSFLAYELSILMSFVNDLPKDKRNSVRHELQQYSWLFKYTQNPKVRMVNIVYNFFGYIITERILRFYNWYRKR